MEKLSHTQKLNKWFEAWKEIWRDRRISLLEKVILKDIEYYHSGGRGFAFPSITTLVKSTGKSKSSVIRAIKKLEESGLIERKKSKGRVNKYRLARKFWFPKADAEAVVTGSDNSYLHENEAKWCQQGYYSHKEEKQQQKSGVKTRLTSVTHDTGLVSPEIHEIVLINNTNRNNTTEIDKSMAPGLMPVAQDKPSDSWLKITKCLADLKEIVRKWPNLESCRADRESGLLNLIRKYGVDKATGIITDIAKDPRKVEQVKNIKDIQ